MCGLRMGRSKLPVQPARPYLAQDSLEHAQPQTGATAVPALLQLQHLSCFDVSAADCVALGRPGHPGFGPG